MEYLVGGRIVERQFWLTMEIGSARGARKGTRGLRLGNNREGPQRPNRGRMDYLAGTGHKGQEAVTPINFSSSRQPEYDLVPYQLQYHGMCVGLR